MEGIVIAVIFGIGVSLMLSLLSLLSVLDLQRRVEKRIEPDLRGLAQCSTDHAKDIEALQSECDSIKRSDYFNFKRIWDKFERMENDGK